MRWLACACALLVFIFCSVPVSGYELGVLNIGEESDTIPLMSGITILLIVLVSTFIIYISGEPEKQDNRVLKRFWKRLRKNLHN